MPYWPAKEENQVTVVVALITAIVAVITIIVQWQLNRRDRLEHEQRHSQEMAAARKNSQSEKLADLRRQDEQRQHEINALQERIRTLDATLTPLAKGVQNLEFAKLQQIHDRMIQRGGWCPDSEKEVADRAYQSYHALGGNGVGTSWHRDIMAAHSAPSKETQ